MSENIFEVRFRAGQPQRSGSFEWADENRSFIMFEKISIMDYLELKIEALSYSKKYLFVGPHGDIGVVFHH